MHKTLNVGLCTLMLSAFCITPVMAQDDAEAPDTVIVKKIKKKPAKQYPTRTVTGVVVDDATGEPMGGVRVQTLGLERYSTLTEEDGSYKM